MWLNCYITYIKFKKKSNKEKEFICWRLLFCKVRYGDDYLPRLRDDQGFILLLFLISGGDRISLLFSICFDFANRQLASRILEKSIIIDNNQAGIVSAFGFESAVEFLWRKLWELNVSSLIPLRYHREEK